MKLMMGMLRRKFRKFLKLSRAEKGLFLLALILLPLFWLGLRTIHFTRFKAWLEQPVGRNYKDYESFAEIRSSADVINIAANYIPWSVTCLPRSMLLYWLLCRRGICSDLRIGVQLVEGGIGAHAWVEYNGIPVNDSYSSIQRFAVFELPVSFSDFKTL